MDDLRKSQLKGDRAALLAELESAGARIVTENKIACPFHDDQHASAKIHQDNDGAWRFYCHAGSCKWCGDLFDLRAKATGKALADVLRDWDPPTGSSRPKATTPAAPLPQSKPVYPTVEALVGVLSNVTAHYRYTNPDTPTVDMLVVRCEPPSRNKTFIQARPVAGGGYTMEAPAKPWPIYNRTRVRGASTVVFVEGEKCVHALAAVGIVSTTTPGGAGKAQYADLSPLAGKTVYLWADADPVDPKTGKRTGTDHMHDVRRLLGQLSPAPRVFWIDPDTLGLPPKGDVVDFLDAMDGESVESKRASVEAVLMDAKPLGPAGELRDVLEAEIAGKRLPLPWPWRLVGRLTQGGLSGDVLIVAGGPGSGKTFMVIEAGAYWHNAGLKVAMLMLEDDRAFHLRRALAQRAGCAELTDAAWVRANPETIREIYTKHAEFIDGFGACIHDAPEKQVRLLDLIDWVRQQAAGGCRIIVIDPITAASTSDKPWDDDRRFLVEVKPVLREHGASLLLVTHPRKGSKGGTALDDMGGGAAYARFSQTVLWLKQHPAKVVMVRRGTGGDVGGTYPLTLTEKVNRTLFIAKARNGRGAGMSVAFNMLGQSLCFDERGVIVKEQVPAGQDDQGNETEAVG